MHIYAIKKPPSPKNDGGRIRSIKNTRDMSPWVHNLFLNQRGDPEDDDGTDDGGTELTKKAAPGDAEQVEQPATEDTTEETKNTVHDEAVAATFHQLASAEASQTSKKEWKNNTHNSNV